MALYEEFDELPMPNLKLGDIEVKALIEYMETESRRVHTSGGHASARSD